MMGGAGMDQLRPLVVTEEEFFKVCGGVVSFLDGAFVEACPWFLC